MTRRPHAPPRPAVVAFALAIALMSGAAARAGEPGAEAPAPAPAPAPALAPAPAIVSLYTVPDGQARLAVRDLNGDGRKDLLCVRVDDITTRLLREDGRFPDADDGRLEWPSPTVGWTLCDLDGDGATEVLLLIDGTRVALAKPDENGALALGPDLLVEPKGFLPRGVRRVNCVRDVDGDGRPDLVIPGADRFLIHLQQDKGFGPAIPVSFEPSITLELGDPGRLNARFAQDVRIPWFTLQDVDGDGHIDLVSETEEEVRFHLARPQLPDQPTFRLDVEALRNAAGVPTQINLEDLAGNVAPQVNWKAADVDGERPNELVIQQGGTFNVYRGGSIGPDLAHPDQVLKASGNVLYFLLRDVDGDDRPDLQILRVQSISLADALHMLIVPGSVDFDVFTYANEGREFSRKPTTRATVSLRIPTLLGFFRDLDQMKADYEKRAEAPARAAALDGDGVADDIVDIRNDARPAEGGEDAPDEGDAPTGKVGIWRNRAPPDVPAALGEQLRAFSIEGLLEEYVTRKLDQLDNGGTLSIGIEDLQRELLVTPGWDLHEARRGIAPDREFPLAFPPKGTRLRVEDLDGNGVSDIIAYGRDAELRQMVQFFVIR